jgi:hypothetical protein
MEALSLVGSGLAGLGNSKFGFVRIKYKSQSTVLDARKTGGEL